MTSEILVVCLSVAVLVLVAILIPTLLMLKGCITSIDTLARNLNRELLPVAADIRMLSSNLARISESLRASTERAARLGEAVGGLGEDIQRFRGGLREAANSARRAASFWSGKMSGIWSWLKGEAGGTREGWP
jgi:hypothetical protein